MSRSQGLPPRVRIVTVVTMTMALVFGAQAWAQTTPTPKPSKTKSKYTAAIAAASDDLSQVNVKVRVATLQLRSAQSKLPAARRTYNAAMSAYASSKAADHRADVALRASVAKAKASAVALVQSDQAVHATEDKFSTLVRQLYMSGGTMLQAQVVLESQNPVDLGTRITGIDRVGRMSNRRLSTLRGVRLVNARHAAQARADKEAVAQRRADVAAQLAATQVVAMRAKTAKAKVDALVAQAQSAVTAARRQQRQLKAQITRLRNLERGIDVKSGKNYGGVRPGSLAWPVVGHTRISSPAGWRNHPIFGHVGCHAGIDIPAGSGTPIHAAAAGIVLEAATVSGYGNMTLISHGGGMATLYGHQSRFAVRTGEHVRANQVIGYVGSTGWSTGPHLHFEVRLAGKPYNPLGWFGSKKSAVPCYHR
jgi:murein DD-endopeptidase MepM/ murein hydrolase activator NlpD